MLDGHLVEEDGEDTLLHLTSILGTQDDHLLGGEVDGDGCGRGHTLGVSVGREGSGIVDGVVGVEVLELLTRRADEHVPHEQSMVGASADDTDADSVLLVPASIAVNDVDAVAGVEVVDSTLSVDLPDLKSIIVSTCKLVSLIIFSSSLLQDLSRAQNRQLHASQSASQQLCWRPPMDTAKPGFPTRLPELELTGADRVGMQADEMQHHKPDVQCKCKAAGLCREAAYGRLPDSVQRGPGSFSFLP